MELSDPITPETGADNATSRRKSGRAKQKPVLFQEDPSVAPVRNGSVKRKRADLADEEDANGDDNVDDKSSVEESDGSADEEELKEKKRKAPKAKKAQSKPTAKKPKTTEGMTTKLAVRPAVNGIKKSSKPRKPRARSKPVVYEEEAGLYGKHMMARVGPGQTLTFERSRGLLSRPHSRRRCRRLDFELRATQHKRHV